MSRPRFSFMEFFAGGGMARAGLGSNFRCLLANDIDATKAKSYIANYGNHGELVVADVADLTLNNIQVAPDLVWGSFPCQDLSLAGNGAGLNGGRSGSFWPFWRLIAQAVNAGRAPAIVALENVYGTLTSHNGRDFEAILAALTDAGYCAGAMVIDAVHFVPQSRPRLFIVGLLRSVPVPRQLLLPQPESRWHSPAVVKAHMRLPEQLRNDWIWWNAGDPPKSTASLSSLIEEVPSADLWNSDQETQRLLGMMSETNREKVEDAKRSGQLTVGTVYRRTRVDGNGAKVQRAEVRFDGVAGCLRTPGGGSSRQTVLFVESQKVRSRLLSPRETARLMGLPDSYKLPTRRNDAYHLTGDGVVVPVVRHLAESLFVPLLKQSSTRAA